MNTFTWEIPTRVLFGCGQFDSLGHQAAALGRSALLVYGGGSIRRNGVHARALALLDAQGVRCAQLGGVEPNPRCSTADQGVRLCRAHAVELVIAIGGGSSIDCAKAIAAGACAGDADTWQLVTGRVPISRALPVLAVPTLAATGSEMNAIAVISNPDTREKIGMRAPALRPAVAILDPELTFTAPAYQTACGAADIFAHALENYLSPVEDAGLLDALAEGVMRACVRYGPEAVRQPDSRPARENLLWAASLAINGLLQLGKNHPWTAHTMEHQLSAFHDVTHGAGLAVLLPAWLRHVLSERTAPKLQELAVRVFDTGAGTDALAGARAGIEAMHRFFRDSLGLPDRLRDIGVPSTDTLPDMARQSARLAKPGGWSPLSWQDVLQIYSACW